MRLWFWIQKHNKLFIWENTYNDYSDWGNVLKDEISGTIEVFDDEEAGFEVFKSLGEYGIVMIDSHGTLYKNQPYILTEISVHIFLVITGLVVLWYVTAIV